MKHAYYNEIDPYAAQWLRNLIAAGHIAPGDVDERSIEDVSPDDLRSYAQCHFFAGVGVWSLALRRAGWPDDCRVWTGSCPCQPFSAAGKGVGFDDERHLWPAFYHLIGQCEPPIVFGEQVAGARAAPWVDLVQTDMENLGYAFGSVDFPSGSIGAPHERSRTYWVGHADHAGLERLGGGHQAESGWNGAIRSVAASGESGGVANASSERQLRWGSSSASNGRDTSRLEPQRFCNVVGMADTVMQQRPDGQPGLGYEYDAGGRLKDSAAATGLCGRSGMADADGGDASAEREQRGRQQRQQPQDGGASILADASRTGRGERRENIAGCRERGSPEGLEQRSGDVCILGSDRRPGPVNGFWRDADWLRCRDGKWRPVEPGTFPLAHGAPARVGRLRAYGNAINAEQARIFIEAVMG